MRMTPWITRFLTMRPLGSLPRFRTVSAERQVDPSYRYEGRLRQNETHFLFQYTLSGEGVFEDADGPRRVPAGSGFLCEVRDPAISYYYPPGATEPWDFLFVCFEGEPALLILRELVQRHGPVLHLPTDCSLLRRLTAWSSFDGISVSISAFAGAAVVFELLTTLGTNNETGPLHAPSSKVVADACVQFDVKVGSEVSVGTVAAELGVSREHLARVFRTELGQTPQQYLIRRKLLLACRLLKESRLSSKEICGRLGGVSHQHLIRLFRKELRMTPRQFRESGSIPLW